MTKALTAQQQAFVEHYLTCFSATEAAKRAGYSTKTAYAQGSRLLKKAEIKAAVTGRIGELKATTDEVFVRLTAHSRSSLEPFLTERGDIDLEAARKAGKLHLVKKLKRTTRTDDENHLYTTVEIELHDAQAATVQLGKLLGLYVERVEVKDWRDRVVDLLKAQKVTPDDVVAEFGQSLAQELFALAGVVVTDAR